MVNSGKLILVIEMIGKKLLKSILNRGIYVLLLIIKNYINYPITMYKIKTMSILNNTL